MESPSHASTVYSDQCYCFPLHSIGNWPTSLLSCVTVLLQLFSLCIFAFKSKGVDLIDIDGPMG